MATKYLNDAAAGRLVSNVITRIDKKQDVLSFDGSPTASSLNPVTSAGVKSYVDGKVSSLADVASSGSYNDLANKPSIPTIYNTTIYIRGGSSSSYTSFGSFTVNASANSIVYIPDATNTSRGLMSAADKAKLDSLVDGDSISY